MLLDLLLLAAAGGVGPGMPAPEISAKEWKNHKPTTLAKEAGNVVVLEFWTTT